MRRPIRFLTSLFGSRLELPVASLLVLLTLFAYQAILRGGFEFLNIDDYEYIVENPLVHAGLTRSSLWQALTSFNGANWHPLIWISLQLDYVVYGLDPYGFHLTNVTLHAANAAFLFLVLSRMTSAPGRSAMVAALFAVHPLHVESVAWVTERKDVLSTLFLILAIGAYTWYVRQPGVLRYVTVFLLFTLGVMAKPMIITLPFMLLLLDYWPLGRLWGDKESVPQPLSRATSWRLFVEKVPLFVVMLAVIVVTLSAQQKMMAILAHVPLGSRVGIAVLSYVTYVVKTLWPMDLAIFYAHPGTSIPWAKVVYAGCLLVASVFVALRMATKRPYIAVGWFWFLGTLVPVIGLVQVGPLAMADHYTYVPLVGLFIVLVWGGYELLAPRARAAPLVAAALALVACVSLTFEQVASWRDSEALWRQSIAVLPEHMIRHLYLARALEAKGKDEEAERHYARAADLDTESHRYVETGIALEKEGKDREAVAAFEWAVWQAPRNPEVRRRLIAVLRRLQSDRSYLAKQYAVLVKIEPNNPETRYELGLVYQQLGKLSEARAEFMEVVRLSEDHPDAQARLGEVLKAQEDRGSLSEHLERAQQREPHGSR